MNIVKSTETTILFKTNDKEFANCRINDLIKISDSTVELITMITSLQCQEVESTIEEDMALEELEIESVKTIECSIIGSVKNGKFTPSYDDREIPSIASGRKITNEEFSAMLQSDISECFRIGTYAGYDTPAYVNGNKFYQRHSCIVGNTGSGKSETVTKIIEETARNTNCKIVIFDIHGEYSDLSYADTIKFSEDFSFPIWMIGFNDMVSNILKIKDESSTVVMSALRKCYKKTCPNGDGGKQSFFDYDKLLNEMIELDNQSVGTGEVYKSGEKKGLERTIKGEYNGKLTNVVNAMTAFRNDKRYSFMFEYEDGSPLDGEYAYFLAERIMGGDKPVKNIDLSEIQHDVAIMIIGAIAKLIYNVQITKKDATPITLVCDEAHVYIPTDFQLSASQRRMVEIFENIAKEGRKFGITLFVASQRPSELNKTIMAQCANYIVMKLNNENDKTMMKGVMADGSSGIIETTTMFSPGDALVIGDAVPIPLKIKVELAEERPKAKTIQFWSEWKKERGSTDYRECLEEYLRN